MGKLWVALVVVEGGLHVDVRIRVDVDWLPSCNVKLRYNCYSCVKANSTFHRLIDS